MRNENFRELSNFEKHILNILLEKPFPGRDELVEQIASAKVKDIYDRIGNYWGLEFLVESKITAPVTQRVPVEGVAYEDGILIEILLHVIDGKIYELELVSYDNKPRRGFSDLEKLPINVRE